MVTSMKQFRMAYEFGQLAVANRKRNENKFIYAFFMSRNIFIDFYNTSPVASALFVQQFCFNRLNLVNLVMLVGKKSEKQCFEKKTSEENAGRRLVFRCEHFDESVEGKERASTVRN